MRLIPDPRVAAVLRKIVTILKFKKKTLDTSMVQADAPTSQVVMLSSVAAHGLLFSISHTYKALSERVCLSWLHCRDVY